MFKLGNLEDFLVQNPLYFGIFYRHLFKHRDLFGIDNIILVLN